jgi:ribosomal protein L11 methyltransferase
MQSYLELEIVFTEENYETVCNKLYLEGITAILEIDGVIKVYLPENDSAHAEKIINDLIHIDGIPKNSIHIAKFEDHDWNKEWEKTIEPIYIKDKIIIYPSWKKNELKNTQDKILIEIDPKMSFGTGHNETTQLILEMMCDYLDTDDKFLLDYGCGTGILAIAGTKLTKGTAVAIDIDEDSIENAKDYININDTSGNIKLYLAAITGINETNFDAVTANISSGVIIPTLSNIYHKLKPNGKLFITGILNDEADELVIKLSANNFLLKVMASKGEWTGFYCIKR